MLTLLRNKLPWLLFAGLGVFLIYYFVRIATIQLGGDIVEYYGLTQTLIEEQALHLSSTQQAKLEQVLHKAYFNDPGYYVEGRDGLRYPVHFFVYSLLALPIRLLLHVFQQPEIKTLWLMNVTTFLISIAILWKWYVKEPWGKVILLILAFLSPLMSFFAWPGPDLWYLCLLLVSVFAFFKKQLSLASILVAIASWHSQPLIVLAGLISLLAVVSYSKWQLSSQRIGLELNLKAILVCVGVGVIALIPYAYNLYAFSALTPWTNLKDGWTQLNGFGIHNMSLWKLYEQIFDLNIGQFWYAPLFFIIGLGIVLIKTSQRQWLYPLATAFFIATAFFYQTNPGWHYGTSGYGPGRHGLLFLPLVIFLTYQALKRFKIWTLPLLLLLVISQTLILSTNNFLEPDLTKTLHHSLFAEYALQHFPDKYNPTPEIFIDRTNHEDITHPTTAIYKQNDRCVKAYVLITDIERVEEECGPLSEAQKAIVDNEFLKLTNYPRQVVTSEATFWPNSDACSEWFEKTPHRPFECPTTKPEFMVLTGINDESRVSSIEEYPYPGIWKLKFGQPILITVPPGYIIHHHSFDGHYLDFPPTTQ